MSYYPTIEEDLKRAREILARGKGEPNDLPIHEHVHFDGGMIYGGDIFAAYKLLESFVAHITTHFRPDHNGECLNCDETEDEHGLHDQLLRAETHVAQLRAEVVDLQRWKDAVSDACITDWIFTREHDTNPRKAVNDLLVWQAKLALDPAVSAGAAELHATIDGQAELIAELRADAERERLARRVVDEALRQALKLVTTYFEQHCRAADAEGMSVLCECALCVKAKRVLSL